MDGSRRDARSTLIKPGSFLRYRYECRSMYKLHTTYCRCRSEPLRSTRLTVGVAALGPQGVKGSCPESASHLASLDAGLQCVMPLVSSFGQPSPRTPSTPTSTTSKHTRLQTMRAGEGKGNERCNESSEMEQSTAASAPYMSANRCLVAPTTVQMTCISEVWWLYPF